MYWRAELKCRKYTKIICSYYFPHNAFIMAALLYSFYWIYVGQYDPTKWPLPLSLSVPFDSTTFLGWYLLWFIQFNTSSAYVLTMVTITSYFVSCSVYVCAICEHFNLLTESLKKDVDQKLDPLKKTFNNKDNPLEYNIKIKSSVDIHNKLYE